MGSGIVNGLSLRCGTRVLSPWWSLRLTGSLPKLRRLDQTLRKHERKQPGSSAVLLLHSALRDRLRERHGWTGYERVYGIYTHVEGKPRGRAVNKTA